MQYDYDRIIVKTIEICRKHTEERGLEKLIGTDRRNRKKQCITSIASWSKWMRERDKQQMSKFMKNDKRREHCGEA